MSINTLLLRNPDCRFNSIFQENCYYNAEEDFIVIPPCAMTPELFKITIQNNIKLYVKCKRNIRITMTIGLSNNNNGLFIVAANYKADIRDTEEQLAEDFLHCFIKAFGTDCEVLMYQSYSYETEDSLYYKLSKKIKETFKHSIDDWLVLYNFINRC